jgi:hypothetical protein
MIRNLGAITENCVEIGLDELYSTNKNRLTIPYTIHSHNTILALLTILDNPRTKENAANGFDLVASKRRPNKVRVNVTKELSQPQYTVLPFRQSFQPRLDNDTVHIAELLSNDTEFDDLPNFISAPHKYIPIFLIGSPVNRLKFTTLNVSLDLWYLMSLHSCIRMDTSMLTPKLRIPTLCSAENRENNAQTEDPYGRGQALLQDWNRQNQAAPDQDAPHPYVEAPQDEAKAR